MLGTFLKCAKENVLPLVEDVGTDSTVFMCFWTQATLLHPEKKYHMCWCVCHCEGKFKQYNDTFRSHAKDNINSLKNSQPHILSKGSTRLLPTATKSLGSITQLPGLMHFLEQLIQTSMLSDFPLQPFYFDVALRFTNLENRASPADFASAAAAALSPFALDPEGPVSSGLSASSGSVVALCAVSTALGVLFALGQECPASPENTAISDSVVALCFAKPEEHHQQALRLQQRLHWSCHQLWTKAIQLHRSSLRVRVSSWHSASQSQEAELSQQTLRLLQRRHYSYHLLWTRKAQLHQKTLLYRVRS